MKRVLPHDGQFFEGAFLPQPFQVHLERDCLHHSERVELVQAQFGLVSDSGAIDIEGFEPGLFGRQNGLCCQVPGGQGARDALSAVVHEAGRIPCGQEVSGAQGETIQWGLDHGGHAFPHEGFPDLEAIVLFQEGDKRSVIGGQFVRSDAAHPDVDVVVLDVGPGVEAYVAMEENIEMSGINID